MQLFPRNSHSPARLEVLHATRYFVVPRSLNRDFPVFKAVKKGIGQGCALVD